MRVKKVYAVKDYFKRGFMYFRAVFGLIGLFIPCFGADISKQSSSENKQKFRQKHGLIVQTSDLSRKEHFSGVQDFHSSSLAGAVEEGDLSTVAFMLASGYSVEGRHNNGSPIFSATCGAMVDILVQNGASLEHTSTLQMLDGIKGESVIGWATRPALSPSYLRSCALAGARINEPDEQGILPLARLISRAKDHIGCKNFIQKAEYLMQYGAKIDIPMLIEGRKKTCSDYLLDELNQHKDRLACVVLDATSSYMSIKKLQEAVVQRYSRFHNSTRQAFIRGYFLTAFNQKKYKNSTTQSHLIMPIILRISQFDDEFLALHKKHPLQIIDG